MAEMIRPGDRVYVDDEGLESLREIMRQVTGTEPAPNHHGTVDEVRDGMAIIVFDGPEGEATSNAAPYPLTEVHHLAAR